MDICEKKNKIQDLINDIYGEYNRLNESKIQSNCENDLEMRTMINNIRSLESSNVEKDSRIKLLEKTICDYEAIIRDLQEKIELVKEEEQENNKFDMLRIQAKEISEKSREIERLNGLLKLSKEKKSNKIDSILTDVKDNLESKIDNSLKVEESISPKEDTPPKEDTSPKVQEFTDPETGEENPNFIYDKITLKTNCDKSSEDVQNEEIRHLEPEPSNPPSPVDEKEDSDKEENKRDEEISKGKLIIITSKKIKYYAYENESPQIVYEFNGNKITDKPLGERKRLENGKHRVNLFS